MAPPVLPTKPLACYPGEHPQGMPDLSDRPDCSEEMVLAAYDELATAYIGRCTDGPICPGVESHQLGTPQFDRDETAACHQRWLWCNDRDAALPVIARRTGGMDLHGTHGAFQRLIPYLDRHGINDIRSAAVFQQAARNHRVAEVMHPERELHILYPGSGSHIAPLNLAFVAIDEGRVSGAHVTLAEINPAVRSRVEYYFRLMAARGIVTKYDGGYQAILRWPEKGERIEYRMEYHGKPILVALDLNRGGEFWATDAAMAQSDIVVFHDSIYGLESDGAKHPGTRFITRLSELTATDGRPRVVIAEDQWKRSNPDRDSREWSIGGCKQTYKCQIGARKYDTWPLEGFYGHGDQIRVGPGEEFVVVEGQLQLNPRPTTHQEIHLGNGAREGAVIITIK